MTLNDQDVALDSSETFGRLGQSLDDLPKDGHLYEDETATSSDIRRVRISRTYLWLLGYLKQDDRKDTIDSAYQEATMRFQRDIDLPGSGEMDNVSWRALQQLAPYDTETNVSSWLGADSMSPAFKRAVHLRLFSYGLLKTAPSHKDLSGRKLKKANKALQVALDNFARVASLLGLVDEPLSPRIERRLVSHLFDHDALVRGLHPKGEGFRGFPPHPDLPLDLPKTKKLLKTFVGNLALVELWLVGYEVRPGSFKMEGPHADESSGTLNHALTKFASDRGLDLPNRRSIKIGSWFFEEARKIQEYPDETEYIDDAELNWLAADKRRLRKLEKTYNSLGARIIDGVRRAISWVFGWFRRAFRVFKRLVRNLARAIHKGALAAYQRLRAVGQTLGVAFGYFFGTVIKGSDTNVVYVRKMADFDMNVFVSATAANQKVSNFFSALQLRVRAMELGGAIIGRLFDLIRMVSSASGVVIGWLGLIISLARLGNWLRQSFALAKEAFALMEDLAELERVAG